MRSSTFPFRHQVALPAVLLLGSLTLALGCRSRPEIGTSPQEVSTNPCPTKDTFSPGADTGPELVHVGALYLGSDLKDELRGAQAVVEALLDGRGRPVACTVRVIQSSDPRLNEPARSVVIASRYRPAKLGALPVPVWIIQPVLVP